MAPLIVMLGIWLAVRVVGFSGRWAQANSWRGALRVALAGMFLFTAMSHFHPRTRPDLTGDAKRRVQTTCWHQI